MTLRALRRFLRTPKGLMLLILLLLLLLAAPVAGLALVLPGLAIALATAMLYDAALMRLMDGHWQAPTGALLTGLFVALILDPHEPWYVPLAASVLAINAKWFLRTRWSNVVNPAAAALVVTTLVFGSGQSWWGALPDLPWPLLTLLLAMVIVMARRINKLPMVLTFIGIYFGIFTLVAYIGDPAQVAELYRVPNINALLFFAGFMLTDPPTSPVRYRDQMIFAAIVAAAAAGLFLLFGGVYFLPAGLLIGNLWESARRLVVDRQRPRRPQPL